MRVSEFMAAMEIDGCAEVGGPRYCLQLYALCESVSARRALEIGLGWGYSGRAFAASMSQREPSLLTSVDPVPARKAYDYSDACTWRVVKAESGTCQFSSELDLLYLDGDPRSLRADFEKFYPLVRTGGLVIIDGYGHMDSHSSQTVDNLRQVYPFIILPYSKDWAHAVHRKGA